ncbi:hypothetical protein F5887DRAFT_597295 [Amanita rubescens]|nr:hypothetical protein F5887DRAFT_597295 [Amanita rubescens]
MIRSNLVSIFFLLATLCCFSFASSIKPRDFTGLQTDMNKLAADVITLTNGIDSVGSGTGITLVQETAVYLQAQTVNGDLTNCVKDISGILDVTEAEANIILNIILGIVPDVLGALNALVQKKAIFSALYIPVPLIHGELVTLENSVLALGDALIPLAPLDLVQTATNIKAELKNGFDEAIAAYS